ncbi:MAG: polysaccharide biosynthesis protein [Casimicrobiaceae bacterium]|nr:polysaccharide biosynthesis protein [Casimicrobiaceae bacterium]
MSLPSDRSLHSGPVPRGGGLGIAAATLAIIAALSPEAAAPLAALAGVWAISALDDWVEVGAAWRLAVHVSSATVLAGWLSPPLLSPIVVALGAIWLIWATNFYNFMDGADGIAAATAITASLTFLALAPETAARLPLPVPELLAALLGAAAGLLWFNRPPARIFMGDGGSTVIGLTLGAVALTGALYGVWSIGAALLPLTTFWADATFTLLRRTLHGHHPARPHRDHYYQRLVLAGLGHRGLLAWIVAWNAAAGLLALLVREAATTTSLLVALGFAGLYLAAAHWASSRRPHLIGNPRALLALIYDTSAAAALWAGLYWVRFNIPFEERDFTANDVLRSLAWMLPIHVAVFLGFGLYRGLWRYASITDLLRIIYATFTATALTVLSLALIRPESFIWPRSVVLLHPFLLIVLMGGARMAYRSWKEHTLFGLNAARGEPVIVLGAGDTGARLVTELRRTPQWRVVALLDDDPTTAGARLHDVPVVGSLARLQEVAETFGARHAILAMPKAGPALRRRVAELAANAGMHLLTVPSFDQLLSGTASIAQLRAVELEDLLGREPISLDTTGLSEWLGGARVLVTGAGGSIGAELCTQVARLLPARLVLLDVSEFAVHQVEERLLTWVARERLETYVADVRNEARIAEILARERPRVVFHAAAYKHVPLTETVNAWEALRNNTLGTLILAEAASRAGVEKFVLISTDKAVRPSSVMGASKRLAELICATAPLAPMQCMAVRFGNVLGSNGSVIPKFREQIARGGPVTVTHPEATRYFMSIPEATQLVLQAGLIGRQGEIYVLDMGEPMSILELARSLIRLSCGHADAVPIVFTGLRPGEKIHEELLGDAERFVATTHPKLRRIERESPLELDVQALRRWLEGPEPEALRAELKRWVPDFRPPEAR